MSEQTLLMTMADVSELARVRRPVVSVWRSRAARSHRPFPPAVTRRGGQELFNALDVATWLSVTGRGNNPDALIDAAAHATLHHDSVRADSASGAVTALLALRRSLGHKLAGMSAAELLDLADEHDPDDVFVYSELDAAGVALVDLAGYVDALVEAAFGEAPAFERMLAQRARLDSSLLGASLSDTALTLLAEVAVSLRSTMALEPVLVDSTSSASDVIVAIHARESENRDITVATPGGNTDAARLLRRRLFVHGIAREGLEVQPSGAFTFDGSALHTAQLPPADRPGMTAVAMLSAIDQIVLQMTDDQIAVVIAPATVLSDANTERGVDEARSELLRSGRVRAIVRLPAGLLVRKPLQPQALWVLGVAHSQVSIAERWTLVADLSDVSLTTDVIDDLVSDMAASLGDRTTVRAHAFRFARLVLTRTLLASRNSLVAGTETSSAPSSSSAQLALRVDELLTLLASDVESTRNEADASAGVPAPTRLAIRPVVPTTNLETLPAVTVERLLVGGQLQYLPGNRLGADDIATDQASRPAGGIRVIGPAELHCESPVGGRLVDRLLFAASYSAGRLTEPGDIVFCTSPRPAAWVDEEGTSVVLFPARILRINAARCGGLIAPVIAADINARVPGDKRWRHWTLRQTPAEQRGVLADALASVNSELHRAQQRLDRLQELTGLLMAGATAGLLELTTPRVVAASPDSPALSEGTT